MGRKNPITPDQKAPVGRAILKPPSGAHRGTAPVRLTSRWTVSPFRPEPSGRELTPVHVVFDGAEG